MPPAVQEGTNLYVKHLSSNCDDWQLYTMFKVRLCWLGSPFAAACRQDTRLRATSSLMVQAFGDVVSCKVLLYRDGCSKRVGFVCMRTHSEADACVEHLHGAQVLLHTCAGIMPPGAWHEQQHLWLAQAPDRPCASSACRLLLSS